AARAVGLIPGEHIGRAGRGAEAAMHAALQDRIGAGDGRIGELDLVETGLHRSAYIPGYMRPGLRIPTGSKGTAGTSDCRLIEEAFAEVMVHLPHRSSAALRSKGLIARVLPRRGRFHLHVRELYLDQITDRDEANQPTRLHYWHVAKSVHSHFRQQPLARVGVPRGDHILGHEVRDWLVQDFGAGL